MERNHHEYRNIYEEYYKVKIPKGFQIHHIDFDCSNNDPLNLECLSPEDHAQKHPHMKNFISESQTACIKGGKVQGKVNKENGHWDKISEKGRTSDAASKRIKKCKKLKIGFFSDESKENLKKSNEKLKKEKRGIYSDESRAKVEALRKEGKIGFASLSSDEKTKIQKENHRKRKEKNPEKYYQLQRKLAKKLQEKRTLNWVVWKEDVEPFEIKNMSNFCRENNLSAGTMGMVSRGTRKSHKGWFCKKVKNE